MGESEFCREISMAKSKSRKARTAAAYRPTARSLGATRLLTPLTHRVLALIIDFERGNQGVTTALNTITSMTPLSVSGGSTTS